MAVATASKVIRFSGTLIVNPSNLTGAFPYSGTVLGIVTEAAVVIESKHREIRAEEFGGHVVEYLTLGESAVMSCRLRNYDSDAISSIFANVTTGARTQRKVVTGHVGATGSTPTGFVSSSRTVRVLVAVEDNPDAPAVYFPRAIPLPAPESRQGIGPSHEWGRHVMFRAIPGETFRTYQQGAVEDLTL